MTPQITRARLIRRFVPLICAGLFILDSAAPAAAPVLDLSLYRGKVVYLDFWASWCKPCRQSFPWMNAMQKKYADRGLVIVAVNVDAYRQDAERFLETVPATFLVIYDPDGELAQQYKLIGMPSSFLIGPDGHVAARHEGFLENSPQKYEAEMQSLLGK